MKRGFGKQSGFVAEYTQSQSEKMIILQTENKQLKKKLAMDKIKFQERITKLEDEIRNVANQLYDLYDKCNETTSPEVYGTILGLSEKLTKMLISAHVNMEGKLLDQ